MLLGPRSESQESLKENWRKEVSQAGLEVIETLLSHICGQSCPLEMKDKTQITKNKQINKT